MKGVGGLKAIGSIAHVGLIAHPVQVGYLIYLYGLTPILVAVGGVGGVETPSTWFGVIRAVSHCRVAAVWLVGITDGYEALR